MKITFITKGNKEFGLGHVYRMLSLAKDLVRLSNEIQANFVLSHDSSDIAIYKIQKEGFEVLSSSPKETPKVLASYSPDIVIFDILNVPTRIVKNIRSLIPNSKLILFDNTSKANIYANHVINALMLGFGDMKYYDPLYKTMYFFGPRYLLLREEFYKIKSKKIKSKSDNRKDFENGFCVTVSFGGSDPNNLTTLVLTKLLEYSNIHDSIYRLVVVLGPKFEEYEKVLDVAEKLQSIVDIDVKIYKDTNNIADLMSQSDIIVTSPGLTMFEAWFLGKPTLLLYQNTIQKRFYNEFLNHVSSINTMFKFIENSIYVDPQNEKVRSLYIGYGKWEVIEAVTNIYTAMSLPRGSILSIRQATENDLELMMAWRSHPEVYRYFYLQNDPLKWNEHYNWWKSRTNRIDWIIILKDKNNLNMPRRVGSVNVSKLDTDNPEIGIYTGEVTLWGKGVGKASVLLVLKWLKALGYRKAHARIMKENVRSTKLFTSLGFKLEGEGRPEEHIYKINLGEVLL